jgi:AraC-like DNA-binding protein
MISVGIADIMILSFTVQGLILAALLLYSSRKINSNRWISALIFLVSYTTLAIVAYNLGFPNKYPMLVVWLPQVRLILGPLLFFYTRSLLQGDARLTKRDYLNFIPLIFDLGPQIAFLFYESHLLSTVIGNNVYLFLARPLILLGQSPLPSFLSFVTYSMICYKMVLDNQQKKEFSTYKQQDIKWLKNLIRLIFLFIIIRLCTIVIASFWYTYPQKLTFYILHLTALVFVYWLGMAVYTRQRKMSVVEVSEYNEAPAIKIYFSDVEATAYKQQLLNMVETEKIYLNPLLKLEHVAAMLGIAERAVSNLLNQHIGKNFNDFINGYRIRAAQKMLTDPAFSHYTIAAIGFESGFNSLATFQRCFKQLAGITPSQYLNGLKPAVF